MKLDENLEPSGRHLLWPQDSLFPLLEDDETSLQIERPATFSCVSEINTFTRTSKAAGNGHTGRTCHLRIQVEIKDTTEKQYDCAWTAFRDYVEKLADTLGVSTWKVVKKKAKGNPDLFIFELDGLDNPVWDLEFLVSEEITVQECLEKAEIIETFFTDIIVPLVKRPNTADE